MLLDLVDLAMLCLLSLIFLHAGMPSGQEAIGHSSRKADKGRVTNSSSSWVTVTTAGDVVQLTSISKEQHQLLADLQHVMVKDAATAPLSGCNLEHYRAARDSPGRERLHPAKGMMES